MLSRRPLLLGALGASLSLPALSGLAHAQAASGTTGGTAPAASGDPRFGERSDGKANAPVTVQEFFSLTCPHCGAFMRETYPEVKAKLVNTGKIRMVWRDFPLDQLALAAAMVARALPAERYEGFVLALFSNQDRWAFTQTSKPMDELAKMAALAGMSQATFQATLADEKLQRFILEERAEATQTYKIDATPSFVFNNGPVQAGEMSFDAFQQLVQKAST